MKTLFIMLSVCKTRAELCDLLTLASIAPTGLFNKLHSITGYTAPFCISDKAIQAK